MANPHGMQRAGRSARSGEASGRSTAAEPEALSAESPGSPERTPGAVYRDSAGRNPPEVEGFDESTIQEHRRRRGASGPVPGGKR